MPLPGGATRDQAMEASIRPAIHGKEYDEGIVLVGNLHAIKQMKWHPDTGNSKLENQYLAGRLATITIFILIAFGMFFMNGFCEFLK